MQQRLGNKDGVIACNVNSGTQRTNMNGASGIEMEAYDADLNHPGSMRNRLSAIDGGFYTPARLNSMTYNDMVYAIRLADLPTTVKQ